MRSPYRWTSPLSPFMADVVGLELVDTPPEPAPHAHPPYRWCSCDLCNLSRASARSREHLAKVSL